MWWPSTDTAAVMVPMDDELGHVTVLTIGLVMVVLAVAALAVDGTRVFIERRTLQTAVDGAAVAAAAEIDTDLYHRSGGAQVALDPKEAEEAIARIIGARGIGAAIHVSIEDRKIAISMSSETETTWLKVVGIDAIPISVQARARPFTQVVPTRR
jgi:Putative Flp pilus-assembly TadE/G-like